MSKKGKRGNKSNADLLVANEDPQKENDNLIAEDPDFYKGSSKFNFPNGDEYEGEFCAHVSGVVWRQGKGTYTTKDGQTYVGEWNSDKLDETKEIEITYPDGTKYVGHLLDSKYSGTAIYKLEEKVSLLCDFIENKPTGEITLIDPNKKVWHGFAEQDDCLLTPEHTFYRCIGKDLGKGSSRLKSNYKKKESISSNKDSQKSIDSTKRTKYKDIREIERKLFAKTKKTPSDLQFEKSQWYQDYINYKNTYGSIVCKAKLEGESSLTAEEWNWYWCYKDFEKKYATLLNNFRNKIKTGPIPDEKWFELIQSGKFMPKPVPIFYPTEKSDDDCDSNCECVND